MRTIVIYSSLTGNTKKVGEAIASGLPAGTEALAQGIPLKPGVLEALEWLRERGFKTAIATSSSMETAEQYLRQTDMEKLFSQVVSGQHLAHGKPAPDIFLLAAEKLSSAPGSCLVVEDSFNGVRAGKAAGMVTVMIPDLLQPDEELRALADAVLDSMEALPSYILAKNKSGVPRGLPRGI